MDEDTTDSEYSAQHYGFTPDRFFQDFSKALLEEAKRVVHFHMKEYHTLQYPQQHKDKLMRNIVDINNKYIKNAEVVLEQLEPTVKQFFKIPENVIFPSEEVVAHRFTEKELETLEKEVKDLEQQYERRLTEIQQCKAELKLLESFENLQKEVAAPIELANRFRSTVEDLKEVEETARTLKDCRKIVFDKTEDESDDNDDIAKHESCFEVH